MTIPFNTGIPSLLKEKGFDIITPTVYHNINGNGMLVSNTPYNQTQHRDINIPRPDYDQVLDWFIERKTFIKADPFDGWNNWTYKIYMEDSMAPFFEIPWNRIEYPTRYEALNAGIIEAIKLIK